MKTDWEVKNLGDVCDFRRGLTYSKKDEVPTSKNAVLRANNISLDSSALNFDEIRYISDSVNVPPSKKLVKDSVMICTASGSRSHLGKVAFIDRDYDYAFGGFMALLVPDQKVIDPKYFFIILTSGQFRDHVNSLTAGANINNLKFSQIQDYEITVPPLPEQRRIVKILDEKFEAIEKLKKVTEEQLVNVKDLFNSSLEGMLVNSSEDWYEERLGDLCEIKGRIGYRGYTKNDLVSEGEGAITLSPSNIKDNQFNTEECTYISWFKYEESPEIMVYDGDILFVKTGSTYGKVALVENLPEKATINPQFVVLKNINCDNRFLYYSLTTRRFKNKVEGIIGGAATPTLSQANLAEQTVLVPSAKMQISVVQKLDMLRNKTHKLEGILKQKLLDLAELKKSYLEQAFAGYL